MGKESKSRTSGKSRTYFNRGAGCDKCNHRGYLANMNLYELFITTSQVKKLIGTEPDTDKIIQVAIKEGFEPMINKAMDMSEKGLLSIDEIFQNIGELE
jgi:type II secretory ATPase GspE/PulE/Tfp pilus assembly ATPase PilB-like protein